MVAIIRITSRELPARRENAFYVEVPLIASGRIVVIHPNVTNDIDHARYWAGPGHIGRMIVGAYILVLRVHYNIAYFPVDINRNN